MPTAIPPRSPPLPEHHTVSSKLRFDACFLDCFSRCISTHDAQNFTALFLVISNRSSSPYFWSASISPLSIFNQQSICLWLHFKSSWTLSWAFSIWVIMRIMIITSKRSSRKQKDLYKRITYSRTIQVPVTAQMAALRRMTHHAACWVQVESTCPSKLIVGLRILNCEHMKT